MCTTLAACVGAAFRVKAQAYFRRLTPNPLRFCSLDFKRGFYYHGLCASGVACRNHGRAPHAVAETRPTQSQTHVDTRTAHRHRSPDRRAPAGIGCVRRGSKIAREKCTEVTPRGESPATCGTVLTGGAPPPSWTSVPPVAVPDTGPAGAHTAIYRYETDQAKPGTGSDGRERRIPGSYDWP